MSSCQNKSILPPLLLTRNRLLEASLKEKQYSEAMTIMEEYCAKYGKESRVDEEAKTLTMDVSAMPPSAARMTTLLTLRRLGALVDPQTYQVSVATGKNTSVVTSLLEREVAPPIAFEQVRGGVRIRGVDALGWVNRKGIVL